MQQQNSGGTFNLISGVQDVHGAYVEAIANTQFDAKWIWIALGNYSGASADRNDQEVQFDIATGPAGFEVSDYADSYFWNSGGATLNAQNFFLPVNIPGGSRISLRIRTNSVNAPITYRVHNLCITDTPMPKGSPVNTLILPRTIFEPGDGSDGPIVEVIASLPHKLDYMIILWENLQLNSNKFTNWDLMTGSSGTEFDRLGEMGGAKQMIFTLQEQSVAWCGPVSFDAGERLSVRGKESGGNRTNIFKAVAWEYPPQ